MKPRYCEVPHNPPHSYGDCIRACIATMIDRDDVPHFFSDKNPENSWYGLRIYLKSHGKNIAIFSVEKPFFYMKSTNEDIPYMLIGKGSRGGNHAIVCMNDEVIHNPWEESKITSPLMQKFYIVCVIV
jgi:hypothetical protein